MSKTNFTFTTTGSSGDIGDRYVTKSYLISTYPNIALDFLIVTPTLWSCGDALYGELGLTPNTARSVFTQISSVNRWLSHSGGQWFSTAIDKYGTLWAWGYNGNGQLGNGSTTSTSIPTQIGVPNIWKQVASHQFSSNAVRLDGTLWAWGAAGSYGELGIDPTGNYSSPVQVGTDTDWKGIAAGNNHTIALKIDGTLWAWGINTSGQLGTVSVSSASSTPIQISASTDWKCICCGMNSSYAIKYDGSLWAWGANGSGQLGNGTILNYSSPIQIGTDTDWKDIGGGGTGHVAAIKNNGTLWTWGSNSTGQLGIGTIGGSVTTPVQIGALNNWKNVSCGYIHTLAVKTDGTLWGFGNNLHGELGLGYTGNQASPVQSGSASDWKMSFARSYFSMAIKDDEQ